MLIYTVAGLILVYVGVLALVYLNQTRLIYPAPNTQTQIPANFDLVRFTTPDDFNLIAGYRPARSGMPTLLFFHGNGSSWQSTARVTDQLSGSGYGVLAVEYRGYGGNPGTPSEHGLYQDSRGAWRFLLERGVPAARIAIVGNSIGSGVATQLATEVNAMALILVSPFDSLEETAARQFPWLPVRMLINDRYANDSKLASIEEPVLIPHGEADTLITVAQAETLAATRSGTVYETYPDWGHDLMAHQPVQHRIAAFLETSPISHRR